MTDQVCAHQYLMSIASPSAQPGLVAGSGYLIIHVVMDGPGIVCPSSGSQRRTIVAPSFICGFICARRTALQPYCNRRTEEKLHQQISHFTHTRAHTHPTCKPSMPSTNKLQLLPYQNNENDLRSQ